METINNKNIINSNLLFSKIKNGIKILDYAHKINPHLFGGDFCFRGVFGWLGDKKSLLCGKDLFCFSMNFLFQYKFRGHSAVGVKFFGGCKGDGGAVCPLVDAIGRAIECGHTKCLPSITSVGEHSA